MNKISKILLGSSLVGTILCADVARVEMGVGVWSQTPSGTLTSTDNSGALSLDGTYVSDEKSSNEIYAWALIKHPLPIIPNLRVEYVSIYDEGTTTGKVNGITVSKAPTTVDMKQVDFVPYYNLLDNTFWMTIDAGIDIKLIQTDAVVGKVYADTSTSVIPFLYLRDRVEIPATNVGIESDIKFITDGSSTIYDARAKVDYTFEITPVIKPAIEIGYRIQDFNIDDDDDSTKGHLKYKGVYAGIMLRF